MGGLSFGAFASDPLPTIFRPVHIIFDLDWTLFYSIDSKDPDQTDSKVFEVDGKHYRLTDHAEILLRHLHHNYPEVQISFFSGGQKERNLQLLRSIRVTENKTALDIAAYTFHFDDLTKVNADEALPFVTRYKKLVENLISDFHSEDVILIDDQVDFASGRVKAVPSLGTLKFTHKYVPQRRHEKFFPANEIEWRQERDKTLVWLSAIDQAIQARRRLGVSFAEHLSRAWNRESLFSKICAHIYK